MDEIRIAVIGLGPAGLAALKNLREEGFDAVGLDRRNALGGLWSLSDDTECTSALEDTLSNLSKYVVSYLYRSPRVAMTKLVNKSAFSDFPIPRDQPLFLNRSQAQSYFRSYAEHFNLLEHIRFGIAVNHVVRADSGDKWIVHATDSCRTVSLTFDKVVFATGCEALPRWPEMPGRSNFTGIVLHAQNYKSPEAFEGKRVLVVGIGNTACDIALGLKGHASTIFQAYRRGRVVVSRYEDDGTPSDCTLSWQFLALKYLLDYYFPRLSAVIVNDFLMKKMINDASRHGPAHLSRKYRLKQAEHNIREWRLSTGLSMAYSLPAAQEHFTNSLRDGSIIPQRGFKEFGYGGMVILEDESVIEVDAVIFCTGYILDFGIMPELEMDGAAGLPLTNANTLPRHAIHNTISTKPYLPRLFQMIFPPKFATSIAFLSWSEPQDSAWSVSELEAMAVAQLWAGETAKSQQTPSPPTSQSKPASFPILKEMERQVDAHHEWWRKAWEIEPSIRHGFVRGHTWFRFLHGAAGTGMYEHLDHVLSTRGWRLWWQDRELHHWLSQGPPTSHAWRIFETNPQQIPGCSRRAWPGARQAVQNINGALRELRRNPDKPDC
ncbi:flavin-binding monooxygenase-like-domain-containing protein [Stachybotrys elegans]|uniref:Flavin-binding monooxygenase-like-domain-containing protein n=1 Tax=Stachybotrys elegans TaxID=80388 RepID=A0A8K0SQY2_9HYPO|nr:flavin-binding monooxygenase-like-domain-containing protein [Stachybotrys elegans]